MKFLVIAVLFLSSSAYAARHTVPQVFEGEYVGREMSTNEVFVLNNSDSERFSMSLELNAETNNNVAIEFGIDADSSGTLSRDEVELSLGWACGKWFFHNRRNGIFASNDVAAGRHKFTWKMILSSEQSAERLFVNDGLLLLHDMPLPADTFNRNWNLVRVVKRGASQTDEYVTYSFFNEPLLIIVR
jgi:hypothetical protein